MMTKNERETTICWTEADDEAILWTNQSPMKNKLRKLGVECYRKTSDEGGFYKIPIDWIAVRPKKKINMTDEKRAALQDRCRTMREGRVKK